ncbi:cytochrome C [Oryzomonas rubra]|uniref:Cytochrome C n=1 Tax=Oryzomonas rubra TaxID=2509454 RepID=A0A5A9XGA6_9BACT|nr:cytochrome C [Oryzomonas rubra]
MRHNGEKRRDGLRGIIAAGIVTCLCLVFCNSDAIGKGSVVNSPHNLSTSGGSGKHGIKSTEEDRICIFCHTPHHALTAEPLWSRELPPQAQYKPYDSSSLKAQPRPDKPTGSSRLCLSCHDGTIALGQYAGKLDTSLSQKMPSDADPTRNSNLTTDLSDDHPISFAYTDSLAQQNGELKSPVNLPAEIRIDRVLNFQCTACHDAHDNQYGNFLVIDNSQPGSPLCTACHVKKGWATPSRSSHNDTTTMPTGCMSCHYVHNAPGAVRLLKSAREEDNCYLSCHNSTSTTSSNVKSVFDSTIYKHPVEATTGVHDETETLPATFYHVECVDCHNSHQVNSQNAPLANPPAIDGRLTGVNGIDKNGATVAAVQYEYEVCLKCHSGSKASQFAVSVPLPNRVISEPDQRLSFNVNNPSFHPVLENRRSQGASLRGTYQTDMIRIYCSDCHNSDRSTKAGYSGPNGPHGSSYSHILIARYEVDSYPLPYSAANYALCFRCHDDTYVLSTNSGFPNHKSHVNPDSVQDPLHVGKEVPCSVCHDPHGVSSSKGATATGNSHLINFDLRFTGSTPTPSYTTTTARHGSCTVSCHTSGSPDAKTHSY